MIAGPPYWWGSGGAQQASPDVNCGSHGAQKRGGVPVGTQRGAQSAETADVRARADRVSVLREQIESELRPVYHVTPGGLKWSKSTDALRELVALARIPEGAPPNEMSQDSVTSDEASWLREQLDRQTENASIFLRERDESVVLVARLRRALEATLRAVEDAREHITEDLQPAFAALARGERLPWPDTWASEPYDQRVAAERFATWWIGYGGLDPTVENARALLRSLEDAPMVARSPESGETREGGPR